MTDLKKRIRRTDWLVGGCFVMMLLVKFFTIFSISMIQEESGATIAATATYYEANPLFKFGLTMQNFGFILTVFVLPAFAMASYLYFRGRVLKGKSDINTLELYVTFAFFSLLINMANDGALFAAKMWRFF